MVISLALTKSGAVILFELRLMVNFKHARAVTLNQAKINGYFANRQTINIIIIVIIIITIDHYSNYNNKKTIVVTIDNHNNND